MDREARRGRPPVTDRIPKEKIIKCYQVFRSSLIVADILGIHYRTVLNYLRDAGVERNKRGERVTSRVSKERSRFWDWWSTFTVEEKKKLPHTIGGLSELSGFNKNVIRNALTYQRKVIVNQFENIDLAGNESLRLLVPAEGELKIVPGEDIADVKYDVDMFDHTVKVIAITADGTYTATFPDPQSYIDFLSMQLL